MAQFDRKDAQRLKERMRRAQGLYGMRASNVIKWRAIRPPKEEEEE